MNVSYVNNAYIQGGAETVMRQLHDGLVKAGHQSSVYVVEGKRLPRLPGLKTLYPRILSRFRYSRFTRLTERLFPNYPMTDRAFRKIADDGSDLIHIHNFHANYATIESLVYLAAKKPVLWTFHRFWGITGGCDHMGDCRRYLDACGHCPKVNEWPISGYDNTAEQLQIKKDLLADAPIHIISPSKHLARTVAESPIGKNWKISYIPNGVDPGEFSHQRKHDPKFRQSLGLKPDAIIVLVVNRNFQDPVKGYRTIRDALFMTEPKGAQFVFVGANSDWAISQLPANFDYVDLGFVSSREKIADLYEAADVFLYASPGENFPCAILEAMSAECCIVSTPTDGVIEQIEHGVSGLVAPTFKPADLAQALTDAIARPDQLRAYGQAARQRVDENFTEAGMVDSHIALYKSLLN